MKAEQELPIVGIAHVAFQVSDLEQSAHQYASYYGFESAFSTNEGEGSEYLKINDEQFLKLVQVPEETDDNRLIEIAFQVRDLELTTNLLRKIGLKPSEIYPSLDGSLTSALTDPDGHRLLFLEYIPDSLQAKTRGEHLGSHRLSVRLQHVGLTVRSEPAANAFYREALGFQETWRGSRNDDGPDAWVNMQMPGEHGDYIEYILIDGMVPSRKQLGSMHHLCLLTEDIQWVHRQLLRNGLPDLDRHKPMVGRSNRWLLNVHDLDGTRTEFMEAKLAFEESSSGEKH
ncbi:VOC family protein [Pelagicoccus sp. NFK12]|uniref:VOC family protein n=1 Tax=Pelagicoccus enzymogenes TaxID=2773457 RepID=A0A927FAC9_9BACT|nr:VOC family protein [Pelagicoccus enzymogenes]MBD5780080.1 VOC family protein [Pelagicoccus enzymogenes]